MELCLSQTCLSLVTSIKCRRGIWRTGLSSAVLLRICRYIPSWVCAEIWIRKNQWKGLYRSEKIWKAILLRELKEIGVTQLSKENAEMPQWSQPVSEVLQRCGTKAWVTTSLPTSAESRWAHSLVCLHYRYRNYKGKHTHIWLSPRGSGVTKFWPQRYRKMSLWRQPLRIQRKGDQGKFVLFSFCTSSFSGPEIGTGEL